jgi:hypothetical protein
MIQYVNDAFRNQEEDSFHGIAFRFRRHEFIDGQAAIGTKVACIFPEFFGSFYY